MVALPLVALFLATVLLPIETYLLYVYCVLVVRAWTSGYEYGLNQMYVGGFFTGNHPPVFPNIMSCLRSPITAKPAAGNALTAKGREHT